ncbi:hypothetical protein STEG23_028400 [Scotinomys teguina]
MYVFVYGPWHQSSLSLQRQSNTNMARCVIWNVPYDMELRGDLPVILLFVASFVGEFTSFVLELSVDRSSKRRQVKPLAASLLEALDYDSSDDSDFKVGDASDANLALTGL